MSSICGLFRSDGATVHSDQVDAMLCALDHWHADARATWLGEQVGFGHLLLQTTPESAHERIPLSDGAADLCITGDLRIDNRAELAALLGIGAAELTQYPDGALVLRAYQKWGEACALHLVGDFAFAVYERARRQLFCARDPIGVKPFYYYRDPRSFAFASEIKGLLALDFVDRSVDEVWIGDFLHGLMVDRVRTLYSAVQRLAPGHALTIGPLGLRTWRYWQFDAHCELRFAREEDYVDAFREKLVAAITRRVRSSFPVGAELSGGLDSSGICAIAQHALRAEGRTLHTFSQVRPLDADGDPLPEDARAAIELLYAHAGIDHGCYLGGENEGILRTLEWAARYCDEPPRIVISLFNDLLYEAAAARNIRLLLSGFGGNQGVTAISAGVQRELLRALQWKTLWRELSAQAPTTRVARSFGRLLALELAPPTLRLAGRAQGNAFWQKYPYRALRDDVADRLGMRDRAEQFERLYRRGSTGREQTIHLLNAPDVALRLEYGNLCTAARGMEYRYPLLDTELIAFYLALPSTMKYGRGTGRYIFRRSLEGFVPDEIRWAAGARASANPGAVLRKRRDRAALQDRIRAIPKDNPVFMYVDADKLAARPPLNGAKGRHTWERDTELLNVLMLEQRLRATSGS